MALFARYRATFGAARTLPLRAMKFREFDSRSSPPIERADDFCVRKSNESRVAYYIGFSIDYAEYIIFAAEEYIFYIMDGNNAMPHAGHAVTFRAVLLSPLVRWVGIDLAALKRVAKPRICFSDIVIAMAWFNEYISKYWWHISMPCRL